MKEQDPYEHLRKCQLNQDHSDYKETFSVAANTTIRVTLNLTTRSGFLARGFVLLVDPYTGHLMQKDRLAEGHDFKGTIKREILIPLPCGEEKQGDVIAKYVKQAATRLISENTDRLGSMRREHRELAEITLRQALAIYMDDFLLDGASGRSKRRTMRGQLQTLAAYFQDKKISEIRRRDISRFTGERNTKNRLEYIKSLRNFLTYVSLKNGVEVALIEVLEDYLGKAEKRSTTDHESRRKKAMKVSVLPKRDEERLVTFVVHGAKPGDMIQMSAKSGILINSVDNN